MYKCLLCFYCFLWWLKIIFFYTNITYFTTECQYFNSLLNLKFSSPNHTLYQWLSTRFMLKIVFRFQFYMHGVFPGYLKCLTTKCLILKQDIFPWAKMALKLVNKAASFEKLIGYMLCFWCLLLLNWISNLLDGCVMCMWNYNKFEFEFTYP